MEEFKNLSIRDFEFLQELATTYSNKQILLVRHGSIIGLTLLKILPEKFSSTHMENT